MRTLYLLFDADGRMVKATKWQADAEEFAKTNSDGSAFEIETKAELYISCGRIFREDYRDNDSI